ncbi:hypothetical protein BN1708_016964 [Verticillium longisporum]|uniref:Uncharacterized protein n=1 Tax=Verticillium longisporum TaxID=100787 RepID=A0A0G4N958_VERLO|nr:hypothetical protein BN1708_016964 [Verticillium longisporum]
MRARTSGSTVEARGVQNRMRKEEKGKKREDGDKKEKKSAGIRGIRGFGRQ